MKPYVLWGATTFLAVSFLAAPRSAHAAEPDAAEVELTYAKRLEAKGYADLALVVLRDFLEATPNDPRRTDVLQAIAGLQLKTGDVAGARQAHEALLAQNPAPERQRRLRRALADCYWAAEDFGRALEALQSLLREPGNARRREVGDAKHLAASCLFKLGRYEEAAAAFTEFLKDFSDLKPAAAAQVGLGDCQMRLGHFQAALKSYQRAQGMTEEAEVTGAALHGIGRAQEEMGHLAGSAAAFEALATRYAAAAPPHPTPSLAPMALWSLARIREKQGDEDKRLATLRDLATRFPDSPEAAKAIAQLGAAARRKVQAGLDTWEALSEDDLFAAADVEFQEGHFGNARERYGQFLALFPNGTRSATAHYRLGVCLAHLREFREAALAFEKAAQRVPPGTKFAADIRYQTALAHSGAGNLKAMAEGLDGLLAENPDYEKADHVLCLLGDACFAAKRYADAADAYQRVVVQFPASRHAEDALYRLAYSLYLAKDYPTAAESFRQFGERFPNSMNAAKANFLMGASLAQAGWHEAAEQALRSYLKQFPKDDSVAQAHYHLGCVYEARKDFAAALGAWERSRAANPADEIAGEAVRKTGDLLFEQRRFAEARDAFLRVVTAHPRTVLPVKTYEWLAAQLAAEGDWGNAQKGYELLVEHHGRDPSAARAVEQAHFALGQCLFRIGKWGPAASAFGELVSRYPQSPLAPRAQLQAAACYRRTGELDRAMSQLRDVLSGAPDSRTAAEAQFELASCLQESGDLSNAVRMFERVTLLHAQPENVEWLLRSYVAQGECLERLGQPSAALRAYERARAMTPIPPELMPLRKKAEQAVQRLRRR